MERATLELSKKLNEVKYPFERATMRDTVNGDSVQFEELGNFFLKPYLEDVAQWLRTNCDIHIAINHLRDGYCPVLKLIIFDVNICDDTTFFEEYERALEDGIKKAIICLEKQEVNR